MHRMEDRLAFKIYRNTPCQSHASIRRANRSQLISSSNQKAEWMEHRRGRKRQASPAIKWSFSPIGRHSMLSSTPASPRQRNRTAEKENQLQELTQLRANEAGEPSELLRFWKSPKLAKTHEADNGNSYLCSSLGGSPTRHKTILSPSIEMLPTFESDPPSLFTDIEDWNLPGSSFFSEADLEVVADRDDVEGGEPQYFESVNLVIKDLLQDHSNCQTILVCISAARGSSDSKRIHLRGLLRDCHYSLGAPVSLSCRDSNILRSAEITITGAEDPPIYLCYNPRHMVSITTIAEGVTCLRRAVLLSKMQAGCTFNRPTIHLVAGSATHDVFETVISDPKRLKEISSIVADSVRRNLLTVYAAGEDEGSVTTSITSILEGFPKWCNSFLREDITPDSGRVIDELKAPKLGIFDDKSICLPQIFSLEESISIPAFGIKGKIDAVVLARFRLKDSQSLASMMVPLELKTGKSTSSAAHRAQTLLYTLMVSQRYGVPVPFGLLYYVASGTLLRIVATPLELQALLMIRNRIAAAVLGRGAPRIPPPINNAHLCRQCSQLENCAVMARLDGEDNTLPIDNAAPELNGAILSQVCLSTTSGDELQFYKKWEMLVSLEEEAVLDSKEQLQAEAHLKSVILKSCKPASDDLLSSFGRYIAEFSVTDEGEEDPCPDSMEFAEGDPLVIYYSALDPYDRAFQEAAIGFSVESSKNRIRVSCDRNPSRKLARAQGFNVNHSHLWREADLVGCRFLLGKDEMLTGFAYSRSNLVRLFAPQNSALRGSLAGLKSPQFLDLDISETEIRKIMYNLDSNQQAAVRHCMNAQNYALMLGMPGTGKTTTLVSLIKLLVERGASVLVASYTHSAVDNLLVKLQDSGVDVLRIGNSDRVDRRLLPKLIHPQNFPSTTVLRSALASNRVVGASCLGANHAILATLYPFDYCIVDEAAQITVPAVIGSLLLAKRFILVGDHYQLPPLVCSKQAMDLGLDTSLFKILADAHPSAVVKLCKQYRMNEDVQLVANRTVYGGLLECATDSVAQGRLDVDVPLLENFGSPWLRRVLDPAFRVCFIDTDGLGALEISIGRSFGNYKEAAVVNCIVTPLVETLGIDPTRIGVITAFRPQVKIIHNLFFSRYPTLEVSTVDKYQGRDKDCIVLSFVRSNADYNIGNILRDWHRLNVAFTRARKKLVMIGSWSTLMRNQVLAPLKDLISEQGWYVFIPSAQFDQ